MKNFLKSIAARLPLQWQREIRRWNFARKIKFGEFRTDEPEYDLLPSLVKPGDWVIDAGANVGHYTARLSQLAGATGHVIAFEPIPETFAILAWNLQLLKRANVTLINMALSNATTLVAMSMPKLDSGLDNYYQARIQKLKDGEAGLHSLSLKLDDLRLHEKISLIKIDVEGHEHEAIEGMWTLLREHRPTLILETGSERLLNKLEALGYSFERLRDSPNVLGTVNN